LQARLSEFKAHSAQLVAISPEYPDSSLTLVEKHHLEFPVLSDEGLQVARQFGIVFEFAPDLDSLYRSFGNDLRERNHTDRAELPVPATYVVDTSGVIRYAYLNADYTYRADPQEIIAALVALERP